jgi:hypothetical protein
MLFFFKANITTRYRKEIGRKPSYTIVTVAQDNFEIMLPEHIADRRALC